MADGIGLVVAGLGEDIDLPAQQAGSQLDILALAADGVGQLVIGHDDFQQVLFFVHHDAGDHGRGQGVAGVGGDIGAPDHDVDAFAAQFLHDVLDARTAHAHAGAHGIHVTFTGEHGHLGAGTGVAGHAHDLHHAVVHFGHFAAEQGGHVVAVRAGDDHLRAAAFLAHVDDDGLHAVVALVVFAGDLFLAGQDGFGAAQVDHPAALVATLHDTGDDLAHAVLVLVVDDLLLGVAHALDDDLLGGLGGDAAQVFHLHAETDFVVDLHGGIMGAGFGDADVGVFVLDLAVFHHDLELVDFDVAGVVVVPDFHIHIFAEAALHRGAHGIFKRLDEHVAVKALVFADLVNGLFEFKVHCYLRLPHRAA